MENSIIDKVEAEIVAEETKLEKKKNIISKLKYALVILVVIAEAITLGVLVYNRFVPKMQYEDAIAAYKEGNVKEALLSFEKLGDYKNSEYYYNTICNANPTFRFDHCRKGDEITFGKYMYEDIEWVVVNIEGDEITLLTKDIIDARDYPEVDSIWAKGFINSSFFGPEKELVEEAFFLSADDASDYIKDTSYAKANVSKRALSNPEYVRSSEYGYGWWLGTSASFSSEHRVASDSGELGYNTESDSKVLGIRPAITVKLPSSETPSVETTSEVSYSY